MCILLTAGVQIKNAKLTPCHQGWARIDRLAQVLEHNPDIHTIILGGCYLYGGRKMPEIYWQYLQDKYPSLASCSSTLIGEATCTVEDLQALLTIYPDLSFLIGMISRRRHIRRSTCMLKGYGWKGWVMPFISREETTFTEKILDWILQQYTYLDPLWKLPLGRMMIQMQTDRMRQQAERLSAQMEIDSKTSGRLE